MIRTFFSDHTVKYICVQADENLSQSEHVVDSLFLEES